MAQTFFPLDPIIYDIQPATKNAWTDVDVSAYVPAGATGVILHCVNTASAPALGLRKDGSTDDRHSNMNPSVHSWIAIGISSSKIFEVYVGTTVILELVGYTMAGVTFLTNGVVKNPTAQVWTDMDCSTEAPGAIGLIFELTSYLYGSYMGLRKDGSSDNRTNAVMNIHNCFGAIIGCSASQICEGYRYLSTDHFYLLGYITDGVTFNKEATDVSLGTTFSWQDLAALPDNSVMGIIEAVTSLTTTPTYGLRKNGSTENLPFQIGYHQWGIVACDTNYIIEGYISNLGNDFFVVGYATKPAPPAVELGAFYQQLNPLGFNVYGAE